MMNVPTDEDDALTPTTESILLVQSLQYSRSLRYNMIDPEQSSLVGVVSPDPDDDDDDEDDVVVDEDDELDDDDDEEEDEDALDAAALDLLENMTDPELVKQMLNNIQARFKNFEDILVDLRCQLNEMNQRDSDILKRMSSVNDEIAELTLLESFDTSSRSVATTVGGPGDNYPDNYSDYGADPMITPTTQVKGPFPK